MYPSEYAYRDDFVTRIENGSANCRSYPRGLIPGSVSSEDYIHCDGTQLKLADSNLGQEQYRPTDYYIIVSSSVSGVQLLFIFSTNISLTTITLHYYSDSVRGRPRLRFYAVPEDFDIWDASITSYQSVDVASVPPGGEPAGHRSVSFNFNVYTKKVLMFKCSNSFQFAVSEVEFFKLCASTSTSTCKYLDADCYILPFLHELRLLNMHSGWDHYQDNYGRYTFQKRNK